MPVPEVSASYKKLTIADLIMKVGTIIDLQEPLECLRPWPDPVPGPPQLTELNKVLSQTANAARNGDRQLIADRDQIHDKMLISLTFNAQYVVMVAYKENNPDLLAMAGHDVKKRAKSTVDSVLAMQPILSVKHGAVSGTLIAKCSKVPGAAMKELQICFGEPSSEESWERVGFFAKTGHIEIPGLVPASKCYLRIRCYGDSGTGPWSPVVSIIVL